MTDIERIMARLDKIEIKLSRHDDLINAAHELVYVTMATSVSKQRMEERRIKEDTRSTTIRIKYRIVLVDPYHSFNVLLSDEEYRELVPEIERRSALPYNSWNYMTFKDADDGAVTHSVYPSNIAGIGWPE